VRGRRFNCKATTIFAYRLTQLTFLFALGYRSDKQEPEEIINTESIRMLDCDGHVIESMSELAEYGDAWIRWLAPGQKDVRRLPFP
jgi:hypothetical protein